MEISTACFIGRGMSLTHGKGGWECGLSINTLECCVIIFFLPVFWPVFGFGPPEWFGVTMQQCASWSQNTQEDQNPLKSVGHFPEEKLQGHISLLYCFLILTYCTLCSILQSLSPLTQSPFLFLNAALCFFKFCEIKT